MHALYLRFATLSTHLKLEQGWITQWPAAFCRIRSFIRAFLLPNSFIASLLSVGWNRACSWFLMNDCLPESGRPGWFPMGAGPGSSLGVPYRLRSSPPKCTLGANMSVSVSSSVSSSSAVTNESVHVFVFSMLILMLSSWCPRRGERISSTDCAARRPLASLREGARRPCPSRSDSLQHNTRFVTRLHYVVHINVIFTRCIIPAYTPRQYKSTFND